MRKEDYDKAVRLCSRSIEKGFDLAPTHTAQEGLPFDATQSLRRQMFSRKQYEEGTNIVSIARQEGVRYSPYLLSRIIVAALMPGTPIAQLMRTPNLITDDRLRREVEMCISEDKDYSPFMNRVRRGLGAEYEFILQQKLRARGIAFESESDLREKGAYKTPDMLLEVPIGVKGPDGETVFLLMPSSGVSGGVAFGGAFVFAFPGRTSRRGRSSWSSDKYAADITVPT